MIESRDRRIQILVSSNLTNKTELSVSDWYITSVHVCSTSQRPIDNGLQFIMNLLAGMLRYHMHVSCYNIRLKDSLIIEACPMLQFHEHFWRKFSFHAIQLSAMIFH